MPSLFFATNQFPWFIAIRRGGVALKGHQLRARERTRSARRNRSPLRYLDKKRSTSSTVTRFRLEREPLFSSDRFIACKNLAAVYELRAHSFGVSKCEKGDYSLKCLKVLKPNTHVHYFYYKYYIIIKNIEEILWENFSFWYNIFVYIL